MATVDLTDEEHAAVTRAVRLSIADDKFPLSPNQLSGVHQSITLNALLVTRVIGRSAAPRLDPGEVCPNGEGRT
jgi:hypothetical protein